MTMTDSTSPLHDDLVALLRITRAAERDLFALLDPERRDAAGSIGDWSAKDVQAHLAAWRAIEARRLQASATDDPSLTAGDPATTDPEDASNARIQADHADLPWVAIADEADAATEALISAIGISSTELLCECEGTSAGTGANGVNHAMAHLSDIARLAGDNARYARFSAEVEEVIRRNHLPPRDSGTILYNIACHRALTGELDVARHLLRTAFGRRADLAEYAATDPDLEALHDELGQLGAAES
jgi:hypothetical protein